LKTIVNKLELNLKNFDGVMFDEKSIFFDIETTGFSVSNTVVYLIGCIYYQDDSWYSTQWFAQNQAEESIILYDFFNKLKDYSTIIHFNGSGFDIPYLEAKFKKYSLPYNFSGFNSVDIYKKISKLKNILKLENLKQKTIENFLEIKRQDTFSGGELIDVYYHYVENNNEDLLNTLLLHNSDDIIGMLLILDIISYYELFNGNFSIERVVEDSEKKELAFDLALNIAIPKRITHGFGPYYISAHGDSAKIKVKMHTDELKYFYPNYKDYYYLPVEDTSIHKSVAFYVDKDYRTKAKAANCYSKKTGKFLPQYKDIVSPYFKIDYHEKVTYFETTNDFLNNHDLVKSYLTHVLWILSNKVRV